MGLLLEACVDFLKTVLFENSPRNTYGIYVHKQKHCRVCYYYYDYHMTLYYCIDAFIVWCLAADLKVVSILHVKKLIHYIHLARW